MVHAKDGQYPLARKAARKASWAESDHNVDLGPIIWPFVDDAQSVEDTGMETLGD